MRILGIALTLLVVFVTACGGNDGTEVSPEASSDDTASPTVTEPLSSPELTPQLGDILTTAFDSSITVYSYESPVSGDPIVPIEPGHVFAAIGVEACTSPDLGRTAIFGPSDFQLQMPDNTRAGWAPLIKDPALLSTTLVPGDCVRGFVSFEIPEGVMPESAVFETFDADGNPVVLKWAVQSPRPNALPSLPQAIGADNRLGDTVTAAIGNITVYSYESPVPGHISVPGVPRPGHVFAAIDVEACTRPDLERAAVLGPGQFDLQMPDNTRAAGGLEIKEPALVITTLRSGDCVRGFVSFIVPEGVTPKSVVFETFDMDGNPAVIKWAVQ
jgi:hypothetical protein